MRTALIILATTLLCGCSKPATPTTTSAESKIQRWEYKVVTVENFAGYLKESAFQESLTNTDLGLKHDRDADSGAGSFLFDGAQGGGKYYADLYYLGNDGWELVSAVPQLETVPDAEKFHGQDFDSASGTLKDGYTHFNNVRTGKIILIFKRPK
jgi:hypothetical protein